MLFVFNILPLFTLFRDVLRTIYEYITNGRATPWRQYENLKTNLVLNNGGEKNLAGTDLRYFRQKYRRKHGRLKRNRLCLCNTLVLGKTVGDDFLRYQNEISPTKKNWRNEYNRIKKFIRHEVANLLLEDLQQTDVYEWFEDELKRIKSSSVNRDLNIQLRQSQSSPNKRR
jgi:hypothetical protein